MLTSSDNVVQSAFPEKDQGEISGLSRSISNIGSSLVCQSLVQFWSAPSYLKISLLGLALIVMVVIAMISLAAAILIPNSPVENEKSSTLSKRNEEDLGGPQNLLDSDCLKGHNCFFIFRPNFQHILNNRPKWFCYTPCLSDASPGHVRSVAVINFV
jgi:hypothetical protein